MKTGTLGFMFVLSTAVATAGCGESPLGAEDGNLCALDRDLLFASLPPDAIPALTLPDMVSANSDDAGYLFDRITGDVYGPQLAVEGKCSRFRDDFGRSATRSGNELGPLEGHAPGHEGREWLHRLRAQLSLVPLRLL